MKTFFASKYPVVTHYGKEGERFKVPTGTIFTISCISGGLFELMPIEKNPKMSVPIMIDAAMLNAGFTQQETIK